MRKIDMSNFLGFFISVRNKRKAVTRSMGIWNVRALIVYTC